MQISQETALLIDTLATAASKVGSTPASAKLNNLIVELLPPSELPELQTLLATLQAERVTLQLQLDSLAAANHELQVSSDIHQTNLTLARDQLTSLSALVDSAGAEVATPEEVTGYLADMRALLDTALAPANV